MFIYMYVYITVPAPKRRVARRPADASREKNPDAAGIEFILI